MCTESEKKQDDHKYQEDMDSVDKRSRRIGSAVRQQKRARWIDPLEERWIALQDGSPLISRLAVSDLPERAEALAWPATARIVCSSLSLTPLMPAP